MKRRPGCGAASWNSGRAQCVGAQWSANTRWEGRDLSPPHRLSIGHSLPTPNRAERPLQTVVSDGPRRIPVSEANDDRVQQSSPCARAGLTDTSRTLGCVRRDVGSLDSGARCHRVFQSEVDLTDLLIFIVGSIVLLEWAALTKEDSAHRLPREESPAGTISPVEECRTAPLCLSCQRPRVADGILPFSLTPRLQQEPRRSPKTGQ